MLAHSNYYLFEKPEWDCSALIVVDYGDITIIKHGDKLINEHNVLGAMEHKAVQIYYDEIIQEDEREIDWNNIPNVKKISYYEAFGMFCHYSREEDGKQSIEGLFEEFKGYNNKIILWSSDLI